MSNRNLILRVMMSAKDQLSGPLRNIMGLGQSAAQKQHELERASRDANKELKEQQRRIRRAMQAGESVTELVARERELRRAAEETNRELEQRRRLNAIDARTATVRRAGADMRSSGMGNIMAGAAMAAPGFMAAKQAIGMESAMADVRKVVDFDTPQQFKQMSDDLVTLSTKIPMSAEGLAQIVAEAGRAGVARKDLLIFAEDAAKMGVAFDTTAEEAGSMMAKWRTAFAMGQDDVRGLSDKINALTNTYGGNVGAVSGIITRIGALGGVSGVAADEIAAMGQVMSAVGVEEEVAATGIKNFMLAMNKGSSATKAQSKAFATLGLDSVKVAKSMQEDAGGAIQDVLRRVAKLPKEQRTAILTQLFGSESVAAIAPMLTNLDQLQKNIELIGDKSQYAGSMNKEFLAAINKTEGALGLAKNAATAINIELGNMLLPTITAASKKFVEIAGDVRAWMKENPGLTQGIVGVYGAAVGLTIGLGLLKIAVGTLIGPLVTLWGWWDKFKILRDAGRFSGAVNGLKKVGGALKFAGIWAGSAGKRFAVAGWQFTVMAGKFVAGKAAAAGGILMNLGRAALLMGKNFARAGLMMLTNPIVLTIAAIAAAAYLIYANWDGIAAWFSQKWEQVKGIFSAAWDGIKGYLGGVWNELTGLFNGGIAGWAGILASFSPVGLLYAGFAALMNWLGVSMPATLGQAGRDMITGLINGITGMWPSVMEKIRSLAKLIPEPIRKFLGINSPSRLFMQLGGWTAEGMALGIDKGSKAPIRAARVMAAGVAGAGMATASFAAGTVTPSPSAIAAPAQMVPARSQALSARAGEVITVSIGNITIHIQTHPGQSAEEIAAAVQKALQAEAAKAAAAKRSSYRDD